MMTKAIKDNLNKFLKALFNIVVILFILFVIMMFHVAHEIRVENTERYNNALRLIENEQYLEAYDILEEIGVGWGNVSKTMAEIYPKVVQLKLLDEIPSLPYEQQLDKIKLLNDKELAAELYNLYSTKEADRLYKLKDYRNALSLYLVTANYQCNKDAIFDCWEHCREDILADANKLQGE